MATQSQRFFFVIKWIPRLINHRGNLNTNPACLSTQIPSLIKHILQTSIENTTNLPNPLSNAKFMCFQRNQINYNFCMASHSETEKSELWAQRQSTTIKLDKRTFWHGIQGGSSKQRQKLIPSRLLAVISIIKTTTQQMVAISRICFILQF